MKMTASKGSAALSLSIGAALIVSACGGDTSNDNGAGDTAHTWDYASPAPSSGALGLVADWWADEVNAASDGEINVDMFQDSSLLSGTETLAGVADGRADIGYLAPAFYEEQLPLTQVTTIPFVTDDAEAVQRTFYDLYQENDEFRAEYNDLGVHVLYFLPLGGSVMGFEEPVESLEGLDGLRVRAVGLHARAFESAGADPVFLAPTELYESIQRGVVDGFGSLPFDLAYTHRLGEVAPEFNYPGLGVLGAAAIVMNLDEWEALDDETQELMTEVSEDAMSEGVTTTTDVDADMCASLTSEGVDVNALPEEEVEEWASLGDWEEMWAESAVANGVDQDTASAFLEEYRTTLATYDGQGDYVDGALACAEQ